MSVTEPRSIDFISKSADENEVVLTIADHLPWDDEGEYEHLVMLQDKLNTYLRFCESGEIYDKYPSASGCEVAFEIVGNFPLSKTANDFIEKVTPVLKSAGFSLRFRLQSD